MQAQDATRIIRVTSPVKKGKYSARVEIRPGDIAADGERAEFHSLTDGGMNILNEEVISGTQYFGWSVYMPADWKDATGTPQFCILAQLKSPDRFGTGPSISFLANLAIRGGFYFEIESGAMDDGVDYHWERLIPNDQTYKLGEWIDWVMKIKFAKDFTGELIVYRRNQGESAFIQVASSINIPTLQWLKSEGIELEALHYWKCGIYRYKDAVPPTTISNIYYLDGWTRGTMFDDVVKIAFP